MQRLAGAEHLLNLLATEELIKIRHLKNLNRFTSDVAQQVGIASIQSQLKCGPPQVRLNLALRLGLLLLFSNDLLHMPGMLLRSLSSTNRGITHR